MSPLSAALTATSAVPEPALRAVVRLPYEVVRPYSTCQVVSRPCGLTVPATVAVLPATDEAPPVVARGAVPVVNVLSAPRVVPASLVATRR